LDAARAHAGLPARRAYKNYRTVRAAFSKPVHDHAIVPQLNNFAQTYQALTRPRQAG
jgi:hypothetical protein